MKKRIKEIIIVVGMIITGVISAYAATVINPSEVSYTSNGQTTLQGAIDDLYILSNTWINPSYVDFTTLDTNAKQTILASKNGVCIKRNNKVSCLKANNWQKNRTMSNKYSQILAAMCLRTARLITIRFGLFKNFK